MTNHVYIFLFVTLQRRCDEIRQRYDNELRQRYNDNETTTTNEMVTAVATTSTVTATTI